MTKRVKKYSTRAASVAVLTVALGLLIWALIAFAAGTVTVDKPAGYKLTNTINSTLSGGVASTNYRAEYWCPTLDNTTSVYFRTYTAVITTNGAGGASNSFTTRLTDKRSTVPAAGRWTARYAYNPNYGYPQYVVFDNTSGANGVYNYYKANNVAKTITYKFHLVDRNGNTITADRSSDIVLSLYSSSRTTGISGWNAVNPSSANGWTLSNGVYSKTAPTEYTSSSSANYWRLQVGGATSSGFMPNGTTRESGDNATVNAGTRYANNVIVLGSSGAASRTPVGVKPVLSLNTKQKNEICTPGATSLSPYYYYFDILGANGSNLTSTSSLSTRTAYAYPMFAGQATITGTAWTNGTYGGANHWRVSFNLAQTGKYAICINTVRNSYYGTSFQIINYVASSPYFPMGAAPTPPADVTSLAATPLDRSVNLQWTNPPNPTGGTLAGIMVLRKNTNSSWPVPVDTTTYSVGGQVGSGSTASNVVYKSSATPSGTVSWTDGSSCDTNNMLANGSAYYYKVYAYDTSNYYSAGGSGTLTGAKTPSNSTTPLPVLNNASTVVLDRSLQVKWTPNVGGTKSDGAPNCDYYGARIRASISGYPTDLNGSDGSRLVGDTSGYDFTGARLSYSDNSLTNGLTQYYSIWAKDDDGNWSSTAVNVAGTPQDLIPPGRIGDNGTTFTVSAYDAFTATLNWTAPADNGFTTTSGNASGYEVRYYDSPISDSNWANAYVASGTANIVPLSCGTPQSFTITGLSPMHHYYFAIRSRDETGVKLINANGTLQGWSATSVNADCTTQCNPELTGCNQCHQLPPTDGLPGQSPKATGAIGAHYIPIHAVADPKQCNVCHSNGQVYDEVNNKLIYDYNHQNGQVNMNYSGMIGNLEDRTNRTGGTWEHYSTTVYKFLDYSTGTPYRTVTGYCVNTYCHGIGAGARRSPLWGLEHIACGEYCHEQPPATGKHVKHYHPGQSYINFGPLGTAVSGYTDDDGTDGTWTNSSGGAATITAGDNGRSFTSNPPGNPDPRYSTYIASSDAIKTISGLSTATTYYVSLAVGDSSGPLTNQEVSVSGDNGVTWTSLIDGNFNTSDLKLYKKIVDVPVFVKQLNYNIKVKIGNGSTPTRLLFLSLNQTPEAPTDITSTLSNTPSEYGFSCGKCHTNDVTQAKHANHVNGQYRPGVRSAEVFFDGNSYPKNPNGNYTSLFNNISSKIDGQSFLYTTGAQCLNLYCHGNDPSSPIHNSGGSLPYPTWKDGYIDVAGASLCGACHDTGYGDTTPFTAISTGSHHKHASNNYAYRFDCTNCHNATVNSRVGGVYSIRDKTYHVNGVVDVRFDKNNPTMALGYYSSTAGKNIGNNLGSGGSCQNVYCHSNGLTDASDRPSSNTTYATPVWGSGTKQCNFCHGTTTTSGMPDYANTTSAPNSHDIHVTQNGFSCSVCHFRTEAADGTIRLMSNNTTLHVNGHVDVNFNISTLNASGTFDKTSRSCSGIYCHGSFSPKWGSSNLGCTACHAMAPTTGRHDIHSLGNHSGVTNASSGGAYDFACKFCHYQTTHGGGPVSPVQSAWTNFNSTGTPSNTGAVYAPGSYGYADGALNWSGGTCTNTYCHSDGKGGPPNVMANWTTGLGNLGCFGCHGGPDGSPYVMSTGKHLKHVSLSSSKKYCDACHANTSVGNGIKDAGMHVNGTIDVAILLGGSYNSSAKECTNVYCHSNASPGFGPSNPGIGAQSFYAITPNWNSSGTTTCASCHSDNYYVAGDGLRSAGQTLSFNHQKHLSAYTNTAVDNGQGGYGSRFGCANCHNATASSNAAVWANAPVHADGNKDIVFWTASTAGTDGRRPFANMSGTNTAHPANGAVWGVFNNMSAERSASCTVVCHSDGRGGNPKRFPNWSTHQSSYGCGSCHGYVGTTFGAAYANMTTGAHKKHVITDLMSCNTCHRLTTSGAYGASYINASGLTTHHVNGARDVNFALSVGGTYNGDYTCSGFNGGACHGAGSSPAWFSGTHTNCASCHDSPPKYAQHFKHYSSLTFANTTTHTNNVVNQSNAATYKFGCGKCHLATTTTHGGGPVKVNDIAEVKFDATTNPMNPLASYTTTDALAGTDTKNGLPNMTYSAGVCRNAYCHSNGQTTLLAYSSVNWADTSLSCTGCHGGADVVANVTLTQPHMDHVGTDFYNIGCVRCHKVTVSDNATISNKKNHVNSVRNVSFNTFNTRTGFYVVAGQTCRNTYCHSDGNGTWKSSPTWVAGQGALSCTACHNGTAASGQLITSGKHGVHVNRSNGPVLPNMPAFACIRCHVNTVSDDSTINPATRSNHVNGTKDVYFQTFASMTGSYNSASKKCSNVYCHSSGQAAPTFRVTSSWTGSYAATCNWCHGADGGFPSINGAPNYANVSGTGTDGRNSFNGHQVPGHVTGAQSCIHCHLGTVDSFGNLTTSETHHINGTRDVAFPGGGTYDPVNKRCIDVSCHGVGNTIRWGGGSLNCILCHSDMGAGFTGYSHFFTGPHQKHTNPSTYRFACEICHATKNAASDISHGTGFVSASQAGEVVFNTATTAWRLMKYKNNTSFRFRRMDQVWDVTAPTAPAYTAGTIPVAGMGLNAPPDPKTSAMNWTSGQCSNIWCHASGQRSGGYVATLNWSSVGGLSCIGCHGAKTTDTLSAPHKTHVNNVNITVGNYGCVTCHKLTVSDDNTITNFGNHVNGTRDVSFVSQFGNRTGTYNGTNCNNNYCHSSGQLTSAADNTPIYASQAWSGTLGCNGCHGTGNAYGYPDYANVSTASKAQFNTHASHVSSMGDCVHCHVGTVGVLGNLSTTGLHLNGSREVNFQMGGTYDPSAKTCTGTDPTNCHGSGTLEWGNWRIPATCQACHADSTTDNDIYVWTGGFGPAGKISMSEYTTIGHGRVNGTYAYSGSVGAANSSMGARQITACESCHSKAVAHNAAGNFFRLTNTDPNVACAACHPTNTDSNHSAAALGGSWAFTPKCVDCHDPHGDKGADGQPNAYMMQKLVNNVTNSTSDGIPASTVAVNFPANRGVVNINWSSFVNGNSYSGLCQICHSVGGDAAYFNRATFTQHNAGQNCVNCHKHTKGFASGDCTSCHGNGGQATLAGRRNMQAEFNNSSSHHIVAAWSAITPKECAACHAEGNYADGSTSGWHTGQHNRPVYLKRWITAIAQGSNGVQGTNFTVVSTTSVLTNSTVISPFCLGCHSDKNSTATPFTAAGDNRTPVNYSWNNQTIDSRYSNTSTTAWGKFASATYNVVPADQVTKAFSPHGNAGKNRSLMSVATFSTYSATKPVACYDCHNAHASNVSGGTSYTSDNRAGGIFKSYTTAGGSLVGKFMSNRYFPRFGGSSTTKNAYSSSSALCFDCHMGDNAAAPMNYTNYGIPQGKSIAGSYYDRVGNTRAWSNWSTTRWSTGDTWRGSFAYKDAKFKGGHFGKSIGWMQEKNMGSKINNNGTGGSCTACHDPHGVSPATKRGYTKPKRTVYAGTGADPTLSGSFTGAVNSSIIMVVRIGTTPGAYGTANYQVSTDGGKTWGTSTNTNVASTNNGVTITFPNVAGSYSTDDTWTFLEAANPNYMVPALKGTWMHSPYKEDRAPRSGYTTDLGPSASTARLSSIPKANDYTVYQSSVNPAGWSTNQRLWDDQNKGTTTTTATREVGGPAPRGNPDFATGSYIPGFNVVAVQGDGFGQGPAVAYGAGYANVTSYKGWNGFFVDENTFGVWGTTYSTSGGLATYYQSQTLKMRSMTTVNKAATPGNFAGLCLQCHAWSKNSGIALNNVTSANIATGTARITTMPHQTVMTLGGITVNLMRRAENNGASGASNQQSSSGDYEMHYIGNTTRSSQGVSALGAAGSVRLTATYGVTDPTADTAGDAKGHWYRWAVIPSQTTAGYIQNYHKFPCAKCHTPHVSRLPRLLKTNCLDNDSLKRTANGTFSNLTSSMNYAHTTMAYANVSSTLNTSQKLIGGLFRTMACHSTKININNTTGNTYYPGGWNNKSPW